jgi:hypothetical protein
MDLAIETEPGESRWAAWFEFVLERFRESRLAESLALADQLDGTLDAATLARIASVCRDTDRVDNASREALEELVTHYGDVHPAHPAEGRLVRHLLSLAVHRASGLQHGLGHLAAQPACIS